MTDRLERVTQQMTVLAISHQHIGTAHAVEALTLLKAVADAARLHAVNCEHACGDVREALAALDAWNAK